MTVERSICLARLYDKMPIIAKIALYKQLKR